MKNLDFKKLKGQITRKMQNSQILLVIHNPIASLRLSPVIQGEK